MPGNMDYESLFQEAPQDADVYRKIERCEKTLRTIRRAVLMRAVLTVLLLYIPFAADMPGGAVVMMVFVVILNVSGLFPLIQQWKQKKKELDALLDEE